MRRKVVLLVFACVAALMPLTPSTAAVDVPVAEFVPGEVLVGYEAAATSEVQAQARGRVNGRAAEVIVPGSAGRGQVERLQLPASVPVQAAIKMLQGQRGVRFAEPNWIVHRALTVTDSLYTNKTLWGLREEQPGINAAAAWNSNYLGNNVYVGVIDEGIDFSHPDLNVNIWSNPFEVAGNGVDDDGNGYVDDTRGWDFANNNSTIYDGSSNNSIDAHGTHVSGTIAAQANTGGGAVGVAPNVKLISGKFLDVNGGTTANAIKALDYFTNLKKSTGLNIVATNNSWGGGGFSQGLLDAINRAGSENILFVAAAGNASSNIDVTPSYPAAYNSSNIIAVASITSDGALSSFSNFGAVNVDLGAPGSNITSTVPGGKYASYNGTSMATPHVSGAVALVASANCMRLGSDIRGKLLTAYVTSLPSLGEKTVTGGRLNLAGFTGSTCDLVVPDVSISATAQNVTAGTPVTITVTSNASDLARLELLSVQSVSSSTALVPATSAGTLSGTWTPTTAGTYRFKASATDVNGNRDSRFIVVTVTASATTKPGKKSR